MRPAAVIGLVAAAVLLAAPASAAPRPAVPGLVAYTTEPHQAEIYVAAANGKGARRVTNDAAPNRWPALSPDGSRIAFAAKRNGWWQIFVVNADGSGRTNIAQEGSLPWGFEGYPDWSPDGTKLAFSAVARGGGAVDVVVYDLAAKTFTDLTPDDSNDLRPRWSPDGTKLAYGGNADHPGELDVYVVNADGSGIKRITSAPGWQFEPTWSSTTWRRRRSRI